MANEERIVGHTFWMIYAGIVAVGMDGDEPAPGERCQRRSRAWP
jgi:hypothetical protein